MQIIFFHFFSANMFLAVIFLKEKLRPEDLFGLYIYAYSLVLF